MNPFLAKDCPKPQEVEKIIDQPLKLDKPPHLSPSTINSFLTNRAQWFYEKVAGMGKFVTAPYFARGLAVEAGIVQMLRGVDLAGAVAHAQAELGTTKVDDFSQEQLEEMKQIHEDLEGYIIKGYEEVNMFGSMRETQKKISINVEGCSIPIIGFIDFDMEHAVIDTKVLGKKPSGLTQGYCIQGATYYLATKRPVIFVALVKTQPKGVATFNAYQEDVSKQKLPLAYWIDYITMAARAMEGIYNAAASGDVESIIKHMAFPDLSSSFEQRDRDNLLRFWRK